MSWNDEATNFLEEILAPVPVFVRPMAKKGIQAKINELANGEEVTKDHVIRGYILASPGPMQKRAVATLKSKNIDLTPYEDLLK
ncbi:hypothetical protein BTR23_04280 [Alkalihalophilus pseudofirmus]|uniref:DUF2621 family protein n=1 Tax=Alkalihalobacterium alkalinitrilicum TaxID=427920 RepID=UPI00094BFF7F|nr:DUF2621 family protein [Alkalihalobacterium alkalinitrilicum]OLO40699.1 hypothetical protein BTR23_04280 [Alkalihalophilus pseudofirmus]